MSQSNARRTETVDRRNFLKTGMVAAVGTAAARSTIVAASEPANDSKPISTRPFGKTGWKLPILAYGGAALPIAWLNPLSTEDRVKLVRYSPGGKEMLLHLVRPGESFAEAALFGSGTYPATAVGVEKTAPSENMSSKLT